MASWLVFPSKGWDVHSLSWRLQLGSFYDCPVMLAWLNECTGNSIGSTFHRGSLINSVYKHSNACTTSRLDTYLDTAHPLHLCQVELIFGLRRLVNSSSRQHEQWHSETGVSTYPVPFPGTIWHRNCMIGQFHWHHSKNSLKRFFSGLNNIFSWLFTACAFVMYINLRRQISVNNNSNNNNSIIYITLHHITLHACSVTNKQIQIT